MAGYQCVNADDSNYALNLLRSQTIDGLVMDAEYRDSVYQVMKSSSELGNIGVFVIFSNVHRVNDTFVDILKSYGDDFHYEILIEAKDLVVSVEKVLRGYNKLLPTAQERRIQIDRQRDEIKKYYGWSVEKLDEIYGQFLSSL